MDTEDDAHLRFRVSAVFTILGRGVVAAGVIEHGAVHTGDILEVAHGCDRFAATCGGIEMIQLRPGSDVDPRTVGLLLPALGPHQVAAGDVITASSGFVAGSDA